MKAEFEENEDGVHVLSPLFAEMTLCGDAFDSEYGDGLRKTRARVVTCPQCARVVKALRGVRVKAPQS
jgi:4-hydroxy-3-methylbut-2-en-1-yl diphosphate synthase IspG/GcpE